SPAASRSRASPSASSSLAAPSATRKSSPSAATTSKPPTGTNAGRGPDIALRLRRCARERRQLESNVLTRQILGLLEERRLKLAPDAEARRRRYPRSPIRQAHICPSVLDRERQAGGYRTEGTEEDKLAAIAARQLGRELDGCRQDDVPEVDRARKLRHLKCPPRSA